MDEQEKVNAFYAYCARDEVSMPPQSDGQKYNCPCCGNATLDTRGDYDICPICKWEDDGTNDETDDAASYFNPNGMSLTEYRKEFLERGKQIEHAV